MPIKTLNWSKLKLLKSRKKERALEKLMQIQKYFIVKLKKTR
jgi:hypothetical protein